MQIHEDFINAISYPILEFLNNETNADKWPKETKLAIQRKIEESIRDGIIDIANQVDDIEGLVIAALRSPALAKVANSKTPTNIALDAVKTALQCRKEITKHVRETRNDSESNPLLD